MSRGSPLVRWRPVTRLPAKAVCPSSNSTSMALISSLPEGWDQHVILSTRCEGACEMDVSWKDETPWSSNQRTVAFAHALGL